MREGFESLELQPLVDMDDWKDQNPIMFDSEAHCVTVDNEHTPEMVRPKSMGFRYQDDEGEWQQYSAQVSVEKESLFPLREKRKGYPKYEQPGQKKNDKSVRCSTGKKTTESTFQKKHGSENKKK